MATQNYNIPTYDIDTDGQIVFKNYAEQINGVDAGSAMNIIDTQLKIAEDKTHFLSTPIFGIITPNDCIGVELEICKLTDIPIGAMIRVFPDESSTVDSIESYGDFGGETLPLTDAYGNNEVVFTHGIATELIRTATGFQSSGNEVQTVINTIKKEGAGVGNYISPTSGASASVRILTPHTAQRIPLKITTTVEGGAITISRNGAAAKPLLTPTEEAVTELSSETMYFEVVEESANFTLRPSGGVDTSDATATGGDILSGKTAYVDGNLITGTIPSKGTATITPGTTNQTIAAGQYLSGIQTIAGDADLVVGNIKTGVNIFGVTGTFTADATAVTSDILSGKTAYVNGTKVTGTIASKTAQTFTPTTTNQTIASGQYLSGVQTIAGSANLIAENIKNGVNLFGVVGTADTVSGAFTGTLPQTITGTITGASKTPYYLNMVGEITFSARRTADNSVYTYTFRLVVERGARTATTFFQYNKNAYGNWEYLGNFGADNGPIRVTTTLTSSGFTYAFSYQPTGETWVLTIQSAGALGTNMRYFVVY